MQKIASALVKAQKAFGPALKTATNPHFRSKYADLSACVEAVIDALHENGIALIQRNHLDETGVTVETVFIHESGEMLDCGKLHVPAAKSDPQGYGSAQTYARRYSLMAACGIAPEDDDGNAASKPREQQRDLSKGGTYKQGARDGIGDDLPSEDKQYLNELAQWVAKTVSQGKAAAAANHIASEKLEGDQRVYLENQLDSKTRAAIKKAEQEIREAFNAKEKVAA
jgi:hypothetical protein